MKNYKVVTLFSNADAGGQKINKYIKKIKILLTLQILNEKYFLSIMKYAKFMIGNSSAGIREAPHLKYQL